MINSVQRVISITTIVIFNRRTSTNYTLAVPKLSIFKRFQDNLKKYLKTDNKLAVKLGFFFTFYFLRQELSVFIHL